MSDDADTEGSRLHHKQVLISGMDNSPDSKMPNVEGSIPSTPDYGTPSRASPTAEAAEADADNGAVELPKEAAGDVLPMQMVRFLQSEETDTDGQAEADTATDGVASRLRSHRVTFQDLIDAAKEGRAKDLEELLGPPAAGGASAKSRKAGGDKIDRKDAEGCTMLHYAARNNHSDVCDLLVRRGADVDAESVEQLTPLHLAAKYRRARTKAAVALAGMDLATVDIVAGRSLRPQAKDETDAVHLLLRHGADYTKRDFYGCTPLHYAAMKGNLVAARLLLNFEVNHLKRDAGKRSSAYANSTAIWRITDNEDMTPLHLACAHREAGVVKMLLEVETNDRDYLDMGETCGQTALHLASCEGDAEICGLLLDAAETVGEGFLKRYINKKDIELSTCLHCAVDNDSVAVASLLLDRATRAELAIGAFVNAQNSSRQTPLHLSARSGDVELVQLLIRHGAKLDALDGSKQSVLHKAAFYSQTQLLAFLLQTDKSMINVKDREENTPLMLASTERDDPESVNLLLAAGANPLCVDGNDRSAVYLAAYWYNCSILRALLANPVVQQAKLINEGDVSNNTALHIAAMRVEILLEFKAKYDDKNEDEETPVHLAAEAGHVEIVRRLLRLSRTLADDEDEDSNTPLHLAALAGHSKMCEVLIDEGKADVEARNSRGWTALDCAASKGFTKVAKVLLDHDSPTDPADKSNVTPLFLACQGGHLDMAQLLLQYNANAASRVKYTNVSSPVHNCNCLDAAIDNGHTKVALALVNSSQWKEALRNETVGEKGEKDTPLRKLIRKMPTVAEKVFNRCVDNNSERKAPEDPDYKVTFYYEFLDDMYASWGPTKEAEAEAAAAAGGSNASDTASVSEFSARTSIYAADGKLRADLKFKSVKGSLKRNHPLMVMVQRKREDLLLHPLVSALLRHKWTSFGRWVYYINLCVYAIFLTAFTTYMLMTKATYMHYAPHYIRYNVTPQSADECQQVLAAQPQYTQHLAAGISKWIVIVLGAVFLLKEVSQIFMSKLNYLNLENLMDWTIFSLAIITVVDFNSCQLTTGVRTFWQWNTGAIGILLSWLNLVLFIRKMPRFGIYVVMFTDVLVTFSRFFIVFFLFILAFSITFFVLMQNQIPFDTLGKTILKTSVMMIGEFEYDTIFNSQFEDSAADKQIFYDASTYLTFVLFLIVMSIIIMNLLVGLAVDDIKAVQDQASLKRLAMQVELALDVEAVLPMAISRKFILRSEDYYPNPNRGSKCFWFTKLFTNKWMSREELHRALDPDLDEWEKIYKKQDEMDLHLASMKGKMKELRAKSTRMEALLTAIAQKMEISDDQQLALGADGDDDQEDEINRNLIEM